MGKEIFGPYASLIVHKLPKHPQFSGYGRVSLKTGKIYRIAGV